MADVATLRDKVESSINNCLSENLNVLISNLASSLRDHADLDISVDLRKCEYCDVKGKVALTNCPCHMPKCLDCIGNDCQLEEQEIIHTCGRCSKSNPLRSFSQHFLFHQYEDFVEQLQIKLVTRLSSQTGISPLSESDSKTVPCEKESSLRPEIRAKTDRKSPEEKEEEKKEDDSSEHSQEVDESDLDMPEGSIALLELLSTITGVSPSDPNPSGSSNDDITAKVHSMMTQPSDKFHSALFGSRFVTDHDSLEFSPVDQASEEFKHLSTLLPFLKSAQRICHKQASTKFLQHAKGHTATNEDVSSKIGRLFLATTQTVSPKTILTNPNGLQTAKLGNGGGWMFGLNFGSLLPNLMYQVPQSEESYRMVYDEKEEDGQWGYSASSGVYEVIFAEVFVGYVCDGRSVEGRKLPVRVENGPDGGKVDFDSSFDGEFLSVLEREAFCPLYILSCELDS
mmetsp:Transcript_10374/g.11262  ORF Transcript_10374/g.11262 Transcript_10374/m.11262 type:complete len:455 (-) Transcript_10374:8-1372(-)